MPSLNFVLPHWLYWGTLIVFPAIAIIMVKREKRLGPPQGPSLFVAYLFLVCSGFLGLHRFYLKSMLGLVYVPLFAVIIYGNALVVDGREDVSRSRAAVEQVRSQIARATSDLRDNAAGAQERVQKANDDLKLREKEFTEAQKELSDARRLGSIFGIIIVVLLLIDAVLLPMLVRRRKAYEKTLPPPVIQAIPDVPAVGTGEDPTIGVHTLVTDKIEWVNVRIGEFVAYWAILSVFGYFYEVVARFVFNSPTNWLHESMFLMYGMQYILAGAYAYYTDQHVRVDVFYAKFSARGKAIADIVTSVFFFIFTVGLTITGARFALDAISVGEHSFTEWGVQYWPVKLMIPIGGALIVLQGICRLSKDIYFIARRGA